MKNFVLIGAAGYIAPKHMEAIKETGNQLVAALDIHDSVGILDHYFPNADFFTEFERFDRHCEKLRRQGTPVDYVSVCSPNYLHDAHCRFGLRIGADVVCEKPVVLNPWNVEALMEMEKESGKRIHTVLQLRQHPVIRDLKKNIQTEGKGPYKVRLDYRAPRGRWYRHSWKGNTDKSGGIASNIGVHFFDMLLWIFGGVVRNEIKKYDRDTASGTLTLEHAIVDWELSTGQGNGISSSRTLMVDGKEIQFDPGQEALHTKTYQEILNGNGVGLIEMLPVVRLLHDIRQQASGI